MKKYIVMLSILSLLTTGCSVISDGNFMNVSTSYFNEYIGEQNLYNYHVQGTVHQLQYNNAIIAYVTAEAGCDITITGELLNTSNPLQLLYTAPDGTETVIAEADRSISNAAVDFTLPAEEGIGMFCFKGIDAVCKFNLFFECNDNVTYSSLNPSETDSLEPFDENEE